MAWPQQRCHVVLGEHPDRQVGEAQRTHNGGDPAEDMDQPVADRRDDHRQCPEDHNADGRSVDVEDLVDRLPGSTVPVAAKPSYINTTSTSGRQAPYTPN